MENLLEQQRRLHEERERLENAMADEVLHKKQLGKEQINSDHQVKILLERSALNAETLSSLYEDKDGLRKEEVSALSGPNEFAEFYARLRSLKEYHRKFPNEALLIDHSKALFLDFVGPVAEPMQMEFVKLKEARDNPSDEMQNVVEFTDEEGYGKYLDLHELYDKFLNLRGVERIDYLGYLETFDRLFDIAKEKKNPEYRRYIEALLDYLYDYTQRVLPLYDLEGELEKVMSAFEEQWSKGTFPGWMKDASSALAHSGAHLDLSAFSSPEELASLGLDRLKQALQALGLKCGGTLEDRAQRLFSTKGVPLDQLDPSFFAKSRAGKGRDNAQKQKDIAAVEAQIYHLTELLGEQRQATRENVERKQARTSDELEEEEEHEEGHESDSDDEETVLYNPKNLPLGWDGKGTHDVCYDESIVVYIVGAVCSRVNGGGNYYIGMQTCERLRPCLQAGRVRRFSWKCCEQTDI
ncbi:Splicing factor 3A subunit 3 [Stylophora pistillata]|uniref:Splicing factor 3A subunit 3 n=1 Tax=Stylophora pistillata TaxID=50429 RepID=A0A2B4RSW0_STYPI|nr:Splicing factor 3A subunit 3 [Stylophora pistillata]